MTFIKDFERSYKKMYFSKRNRDVYVKENEERHVSNIRSENALLKASDRFFHEQKSPETYRESYSRNTRKPFIYDPRYRAEKSEYFDRNEKYYITQSNRPHYTDRNLIRDEIHLLPKRTKPGSNCYYDSEKEENSLFYEAAQGLLKLYYYQDL
ncbi:hypothetical protein CWI38_0469p0030 [Hamiltosporidium tvaerminnensis]|uniref:Uncharacterized protein n=2 Tax=Hamiltosporidium TaxID=1176354 RepID=A0A4Q9LJ53_9MICR|nr:hypothetical protein LUQ84_002833 [Hamiltosporidium tvaerminnensis]TBU00919.1 hypothetical protein CWI39_1537p0010 [Hamiltosporidium magnivora]TBU03461.1 hypothetical protein CWI37_0291p0020 [Hamiltosporidium tvaerminnensis]TBU08228.1 hypothetical protein CWI36_0166p0020 [Hamiltosporidium magnivora]TBU08523.1 hypothetical protein CWI36_0128p0030 [Hamiltosporidium magnivora]